MPSEELISKPDIKDNVIANETVGSLLSQERVRRGFSEKEVAEKLHITKHYVRSIEADLYEKLPGAVFAKGYIKSYAILLKLNVDEVISLYDEYIEQLQASKDDAGRLRARRKKDRNRLWVIVPVVVFVIGFAGLWAIDKYSDEEDTVTSGQVPEPSAILQTTASIIPSPTLSVSNSTATANRSSVRQSSISAESELNLDLATVINTLSNPEDTTRAPILAADADIVSIAQDTVIKIGMTGDDLLKITFAGESWIEVSDSEENQIYRNIRAEGDILEIHGNAPFNILLGDAPFISLSLNGDEIDVSGDIRIDNSARLTVGL